MSLCAVRLKIIDLVSGDQPMFSEDRDTVIAFTSVDSGRALKKVLTGE